MGTLFLLLKMVRGALVEIGRVATICYGEDAEKMVAIVDVIDANRVIVCGAAGTLSDMARQSYPLKRLALTPFKVGMKRGARIRSLKRACAKADVIAKFKATRASKRMEARAAKRKLNDFERFKLRVAKKKVGVAVNREMKNM